MQSLHVIAAVQLNRIIWLFLSMAIFMNG